MIARLVLSRSLSLLFSCGTVLVALAAVAGSLTITGNGSELTTIEPLARAFEKANPRAYLDVVWDANSKPAEMVKSGQAHIAVTGIEAADLSATPIAWDGIDILVHHSQFHEGTSRSNKWPIFSPARSPRGQESVVPRQKSRSSIGLATKISAMRVNRSSV